MIRMIQSQSAGHAKAYFADALSKSDYFMSDQELPGFWQGKLAARLGLSGATFKEAFYALCENLHPGTGQHLTPRIREERTTGYDINFHCPKSVSILHAFAKDDHILKAFQASVTETMQAIEADSKTRVRQGGVYDDRHSGELVWCHFTHQTARPVAGALPDPHLHSHCFVFNATWDDTEHRLKAGQFRDTKRDMPYYQAQFHKSLSDKLMDLGYAIRRTDKSFEIAGVPQNAIALFSKRTDEIGRIAKEKGITDAKELDELGSRTRAKKQKGSQMTDLIHAWRSQIETLGVEPSANQVVRFAPPAPDVQPLTARQCVDFVMSHCFERASVMTERSLLSAAYRYSMGLKVNANDIKAAFKDDDRLIKLSEKGREVCTTKEVLTEERQMVALAKQGQGKIKPLYETAPDIALIGQQGEAIKHVLTTSNRVSIIRGAAGTGKTTLMKEAAAHIENAGKQVVVVAPTAEASRGVLKGEGFSEADTVARLIIDDKLKATIKDNVLWVDEAGLLGTKDMLALLELTTKNNAQLILGGDTRQHASVVRGDALRVLNTVAGIKTAEVNRIYRQQNDHYRDAIQALAKGDMQQGFQALDQLGFIKTVDSKQSTTVLVDDYLNSVKRGNNALIVSPTHEQGDDITAALRARMRSEGLLGSKELTALRYDNLNLTAAEKSDHRNYEDGYVVKFQQNVAGFKRGSHWTIDKTNSGIQLKNAAGDTKDMPTADSEHFSVYKQKEMGLSKGDKIRITDNSFDTHKKRLNNGAVFEVVSVSLTDKTLLLQNQISKEHYTLHKDFGHIAHAHCVTSYASQGKTVDEVFIYQPAATFKATNAKQFYVSTSRAKQRATVYTDHKEELLEAASELGNRVSASEVFGRSKLHGDFVTQALRQPKEQDKTNDKSKTLKTKFDDIDR